MTAAMSPGLRRFVDFLGELGPRWGLPAAPCRVHGYLYLVARPVTDTELASVLQQDAVGLRDALAWLEGYRLIDRDGAAWRTDGDPWDLMMRALDERRRREIEPALETLRDCRRAARNESAGEPAAAAQIDKLLALVEDLAAIDVQARRLPSKTLRRIVGVGGRTLRFIDRAFGKGDRP